MSTLDEQVKAQNLKHQEDLKVAAQEHMVELERLRKQSEAYFDPKLIAFRKRREEQVLKHRGPKVLLHLQQK